MLVINNLTAFTVDEFYIDERKAYVKFLFRLQNFSKKILWILKNQNNMKKLMILMLKKVNFWKCDLTF